VTQKVETELIEAAVAGDIDSFGQLARRHYPGMVAIGYSVLADHQLAEDAAQEAFARALAGLRSLKTKTKFAPWLASICRNVAKDMLMAKTRQTDAEDLSQVADGDSNDESSQAVHRAIEQLPVSAKELIVLRYYDGLSYDEISCVLGISKATINGRLTRAKRKMAKYLQRDGFLETGRGRSSISINGERTTKRKFRISNPRLDGFRNLSSDLR
jgi:RNA polymerase sigma-70 factor (ECF subfamily)